MIYKNVYSPQDNHEFGSKQIKLILEGQEHTITVPCKYNGHDHTWQIAIDSDGEVYAYEDTPKRLNSMWDNKDSEFTIIGYFDNDDGSCVDRLRDWSESLRYVQDVVIISK